MFKCENEGHVLDIAQDEEAEVVAWPAADFDGEAGRAEVVEGALVQLAQLQKVQVERLEAGEVAEQARRYLVEWVARQVEVLEGEEAGEGVTAQVSEPIARQIKGAEGGQRGEGAGGQREERVAAQIQVLELGQRWWWWWWTSDLAKEPAHRLDSIARQVEAVEGGGERAHQRTGEACELVRLQVEPGEAGELVEAAVGNPCHWAVRDTNGVQTGAQVSERVPVEGLERAEVVHDQGGEGG